MLPAGYQQQRTISSFMVVLRDVYASERIFLGPSFVLDSLENNFAFRRTPNKNNRKTDSQPKTESLETSTVSLWTTTVRTIEKWCSNSKKANLTCLGVNQERSG